MPFEYWGASIVTFLQLQLGYNVLPEPFEVNDVLGILVLLQRQNDPNGGPLKASSRTRCSLRPWRRSTGRTGLAMFQDLRWFNDPSAQTMIPPGARRGSRPPDISRLPDIKADTFPDLRQTVEEICDALRDSTAGAGRYRRFDQGRQLRLDDLGRQDGVGQPHHLLRPAAGLRVPVPGPGGLDPRWRVGGLRHDHRGRSRDDHRPHAAPCVVDPGGHGQHPGLVHRGTAERFLPPHGDD